MSNKNKIFSISAVLLVAAMAAFASNPKSWMGERTISIDNEVVVLDESGKNPDNGKVEPEQPKRDANPYTGIECDNAKRRPYAVMMAGDLEAWPLSGISDADIVVEMPVITDGITRYMAVFVCSDPKEIGSIRSSRHDFIPLAMGFDAIYAHWGGSYLALEKLDNKIMDNVNALYLDGSVFYRKAGPPKPHDGFTTVERLSDYAKRMGYRTDGIFESYKFYDEENPQGKDGELGIAYPSIFKVEYDYNPKTNSYLRFKGDKKDVDKLTGKQIEAKNVIIMFAGSRQVDGQYNDVDIEGEGEAIAYQNGWEIKGAWKKDKGDLKSKIYFYNESGEELKFVRGKTWIQVVQPNQKVTWNAE